MELCRNCPVPASCAIRGKCITDLAPVPDPRLSITADEFAAMARDAERWKYARTLADGKHKDGGSWIEIILPWPNGTYHRTEDCADASVDAALARSPVEPVSDHDKIVSWNWVLRSIENNPDHAVIISRTPDGLCFMHGNPVPELESANELLRDALKELVELKDMKEILDANESTPLKVWSIEEEYRERKPKAWELARAVLNDTNPVMDAAPACERLAEPRVKMLWCASLEKWWNLASDQGKKKAYSASIEADAWKAKRIRELDEDLADVRGAAKTLEKVCDESLDMRPEFLYAVSRLHTAIANSERCPNCDCGDYQQFHHDGSRGTPECWWWECSSCGYKTQPE